MNIPDRHLYQGQLQTFTPWLDDRGEFRQVYDRGSQRSLVSPDRVWVIYRLLHQCLMLRGEVWEIGVYKGGTAAMMADILKRRECPKTLRIFDTFTGMPESTPDKDLHQIGEFGDTDAEEVRKFIDYAHLDLNKADIRHVPDAPSPIAFAHVDADNYASTIASLHLVWPALVAGGVIVNDDYGHLGCPGAKMAVDDFFLGSGHYPLALSTGQAVIFKSK